jgi:hypothetical protein
VSTPKAKLRPARVLLLVLAMAAIGAAAIEFWPRSSGEIPDELVGVWRTSAPSHATRPFEIDKRTLLFRTGDGPYDYSIHPIRRVEAVEHGASTHYWVEYANHGEGFEFAFSYTASPEEVIQLANQKDLIWKKAGATHPPLP